MQTQTASEEVNKQIAVLAVTLKSPGDEKVRTTLYNIVNITTGQYSSVAFIGMVTLEDFFHRLQIFATPCKEQ